LGIAHRDIKTDNIMIHTTTFDVKYIDFGLACNLGACYRAVSAGTPDYSAPELLTNLPDIRKPQTLREWFRADYWSLGIILVEIICGQSYYKNVFNSIKSTKTYPTVSDLVEVANYLLQHSYKSEQYVCHWTTDDKGLNKYLTENVRTLLSIPAENRQMILYPDLAGVSYPLKNPIKL
jgi:serine/threonine protein kinase